MRLKDTVTIVTRGGVGIGRTYAEALVREGATVVVADIAKNAADRTASSLRGAGGEAMSVHVDVSSATSTEAMTKAVFDRYGRIDVLINNAALYSAILPKKAFADISAEEAIGGSGAQARQTTWTKDGKPRVSASGRSSNGRPSVVIAEPQAL